MPSAIDRVRGLYDAFARGDVPTILAALSPDVRWEEAEGGPYGGVYLGPDAVLAEVFMKFGEEWEDFAAVPRRFFADGDTVVALGPYSGTFQATGKRFEAPFCHEWDFDGERVASFRQITDTVVHRRPMS